MQFPHEFKVELESPSAREGLIVNGGPAILGGAPTLFGGRDDWWSPETLLLGSAALCLMATVRSYFDREHVGIGGYLSRVEGTLDKSAQGLMFTSIRIQVELTVEERDVQRAAALFDKAKRQCVVTHSLKTPVEATVEIKSATVAAAHA